MLTRSRVGIAVQIPAGRLLAALRQSVCFGQRRPDLFITSELGVACDQDEETVGMRLNTASRQRGLDRLVVTPQMIKHPRFVGEPGGGPGIAWTKTPPRVNRFQRFLVAAVEAQCDSEIEMTESEVTVELDCVARVLYGGPDIARPKAGLGEDILDLRVFSIERCSPKSGFPSLTHKWSEVLDGAVVPLHNQGTSEPKVGVRQVRIERKCSFEH